MDEGGGHQLSPNSPTELDGLKLLPDDADQLQNHKTTSHLQSEGNSTSKSTATITKSITHTGLEKLTMEELLNKLSAAVEEVAAKNKENLVLQQKASRQG